MTLFDENVRVEPAPAPRRRGLVPGMWALSIALIALLVMSFLPTAYVIQQKGPVYDVLGAAENSDGEQEPLIVVNDAQTYPTSGKLDLLTVQVVGNRERTPSWFELALAWFDPSRAVVPIDYIFPAGQTTQQRNDENAQRMVDSQTAATAAALSELRYDIDPHPGVHSLTEDSAAEGILEPGDVIVSANGTPVETVTEVQDIVAASEGADVELAIERGDDELTVSVTPREVEQDEQTRWLLGVSLMANYDFPVDVDVQINAVGGPSAGMMFALGIIDKLTPGELTGGAHIAGTGTITAEGVVGPIGGIRQKLYGAKDAGATAFLAPKDNCDEVVGHVPDGLQVFSVATLDDALEVIDTVADGGDLGALPTCTS